MKVDYWYPGRTRSGWFRSTAYLDDTDGVADVMTGTDKYTAVTVTVRWNDRLDRWEESPV